MSPYLLTNLLTWCVLPARRPGTYAKGVAPPWIKESYQVQKQAQAPPRNFSIAPVATTPSIPTYHQSFGYEEEPRSKALVLQAPPSGATTEQVLKVYTSHGQGRSPGFGRSRTERTNFAKLAPPAPPPGKPI